MYDGRGKHVGERIVVEVTDETREVMGVTTVVVRDTVTLDGSVIEDTFDWYAQHRDGTVWYFGEETKEYEDGVVTTTAGSWEAGVDGALPGVVMPADPKVGQSYRQEFYEGEAEDEAKVLAVDGRARVPAGSFDHLVVTRDFTSLDPGAVERKYYARGVGFVLEHGRRRADRVVLVEQTRGG